MAPWGERFTAYSAIIGWSLAVVKEGPGRGRLGGGGGGGGGACVAAPRHPEPADSRGGAAHSALNDRFFSRWRGAGGF